jgi:UTP--glucose-1-phosphate uridylyltransferase
MKQNLVRKALFPAGGFGTGILPATKSTPKELLTVVDKPMIHYGVEEALRAGVRQMIFVTHRSKRAIEDHFDKAYELESALALQNRYELLAELRHSFPPDVTYLFVRQTEPLGLGHALSCARVLVADEPVLVIVPDELFDASVPASGQLLETFAQLRQPVLGTLPPGRRGSGHAYAEAFPVGPRVGRVTRIGVAPGSTAIPAAPLAGRLVLTPEVFDYLATTPPRPSGEIELADALAAMLAARPMFVRELEGERFDCGSRLGYLAATVHFGLRHPAVGKEFAALLRSVAAGAATAPARERGPALLAANE